MNTTIATPYPQAETDILLSEKRIPKTAIHFMVGSAISLGVLGMYEGFTHSKSSNLEVRILESLSQGIVYATGFGFVAEKLKR